MKQALRFSFFLSIGLLFIWLSVKNLTSSQRTDIAESFRAVDYSFIIISLIIGIGSHVLRAMRWRRLLNTMGYYPGLKNTFYAVMIGYFANFAIPRLGEVTRCGILNKYENIPVNKGLGTVITERALDLIIFMVLFLLTIMTQYAKLKNYIEVEILEKLSQKASIFAINHILAYILLAIFILLACLYIVFRKRIYKTKFHQKSIELLMGFWDGLRSVARVKNPMYFIAESVGIWVLYYLMVYVSFFAFSETAHLGLEVALAILVLGTVGIMITPGGIGLYPVLVGETARIYSVVYTTGLAFGWVIWSAQAIMIIGAGSLSLLFLALNLRKNDALRKNIIKNS